VGRERQDKQGVSPRRVTIMRQRGQQLGNVLAADARGAEDAAIRDAQRRISVGG